MPPDRTTMPAIPPPSPYPVMQRVDPSPDVQQRVASAIEACTEWQPQAVQPAKGDASLAQLSTEAQVCGLLDRWPLLHNGEELQAVSVGVGLALATAAACMVAWTVFRGALGIVPLAPLARRLIARAAGGALCGVGLATFTLLLGLSGFAAPTLEEAAGNHGRGRWNSTGKGRTERHQGPPKLWRSRAKQKGPPPCQNRPDFASRSTARRARTIMARKLE